MQMGVRTAACRDLYAPPCLWKHQSVPRLEVLLKKKHQSLQNSKVLLEKGIRACKAQDVAMLMLVC